MRRSVIVDATARVISHSALVLSLYLLLAGHNQPGGGFVGGLVAGAALAVHYIAGGYHDVRAVLRVPPMVVLGAGLALAAGTAAVPLVGGAGALESNSVEVGLPVLGHAKLASTLVFDTGVYAVVVGLVAMVFDAFGEAPRPEGGSR